MCGSCVAACTFNALEVDMMRRSVTLSRKLFPDPSQSTWPNPSFSNSTVWLKPAWAAACEKNLPNRAIRPVRNPDTRFPCWPGTTAPSSAADAPI